MDHSQFLLKILEIDSIRFVGMYDKNGKKITDGYQASTIPHLSREEMQNSIRYDLKRWDTYKKFHRQLGDTQYSMVKYDKAILITFSFNESEYLLVSIEPNTNYMQIMDEISDLIMKNPVIRS